MKVGIITDTFPPTVGGMEVFAEGLVNHLASSGAVDTVDVLTFTSGDTVTPENVKVTRSSASGTLEKVHHGFSWVRQGEYDIVHSLTLYPSGLVAALTGRLGLVDRTFVTVYGTDALAVASHPIHRHIRKFIFGSVDSVLFFSDSTREKTHKSYGASFESETVYPGAPQLLDHGPTGNLPDTGDRFVVLTVARLVERKGIDDLVRAVEPLDDVALWIVGDGPYREELERLRDSLNLEDRVVFVGQVPHEDVPAFYAASDCFCMPSLHLQTEGDIEGLGLVFLEAQQLGIPVIGTESGGIPEAFADGESGIIVPEGSPDKIRGAIQQLAGDPELYAEYSAAAESFVADNFSWERCIGHHLDVYTDDYP